MNLKRLIWRYVAPQESKRDKRANGEHGGIEVHEKHRQST